MSISLHPIVEVPSSPVVRGRVSRSPWLRPAQEAGSGHHRGLGHPELPSLAATPVCADVIPGPLVSMSILRSAGLYTA